MPCHCADVIGASDKLVIPASRNLGSRDTCPGAAISLLAAMQAHPRRGMLWRVQARTVIVDDNASFLAAATSILDGSEFAIVGKAKTAAEAVLRVEELEPDVVLIDIDLGEDSGFELAQRLTEMLNGGGPKLVLISAHPEDDFADLIAESPALGFIAKWDLSAGSLAELLRVA